MERNVAQRDRYSRTAGIAQAWSFRISLLVLSLVVGNLGAVTAASPEPSPKGALSSKPRLPLHERIDRLIESKLDRDHPGRRPAKPATDAEFLRRAWLDLAGMIPTAETTRAFLDETSPYKRERLVDELLNRPEYARRMQYVFDSFLMERRADLHVPSPQWRDFLRKSFAENVPYDMLVRRILSADGTDPKTRPAA